MKKYLSIIVLALIASSLLVVGNAKAIGRCELEVRNVDTDDPCVVINDLEKFDKGYNDYYRECTLPKIIEEINKNAGYCHASGRNMVLFQPEGVPNHDITFDEITESTETNIEWLESIHIKRNISFDGWKFAFEGNCLGDPEGNGDCDDDSNSENSNAVGTEKNWDEDHNVSILIPDRLDNKDIYRSKLIIEGPSRNDEDVESDNALPGFQIDVVDNGKSLALLDMDIVVESGRSLIFVKDGVFLMASTHIEAKDVNFIYRGDSDRIIKYSRANANATYSIEELGNNSNNIRGRIKDTVFEFTNKMPRNFDPTTFFNEIMRTRFDGLKLGNNPLYRFSWSIADMGSAFLSCTMADDESCLLNTDIDIFAIDEDGYVVQMQTDDGRLALLRIGIDGVYFTRNGKRLLIDGYRHEGVDSSNNVIECGLLPMDTAEPTIVCPKTLMDGVGEGVFLYPSESAHAPVAKIVAHGDASTIKSFNGSMIAEVYFDEENREIRVVKVESFKTIYCSVSTTSCSPDEHQCMISCSDEISVPLGTRGAFETFSIAPLKLTGIRITNNTRALLKTPGEVLDWDIGYITPRGDRIILRSCMAHSIVNSDGECIAADGFETSSDGIANYPECKGEPIPSADGTECVCEDSELEPAKKYSDILCLQPCGDGERRSWTGRCVAEEDESDDTDKTIQLEDDDENEETGEVEEDLSYQEDGWGSLIGSNNDSDNSHEGGEPTNTAIEAGGCTLAPNTAASPSGILPIMIIILLTGLGIVRRKARS
jgi:hypothetical protein